MAIGRTKRLFSRMASLALAGTVVCVGLGLGASDEVAAVAAPAAQPYWSDGEMPSYPGGLEFPLAQGLSVNGMPIRVSHFSTTDAPEAVRDHFARAFEREGFVATVRPGAGGGFVVTAMGPKAAQRVVAIVPRRAGCDVFPSLLPLDAQPQEPAGGGEALPFSPQAVGIMRVAARGEGGEVVTWQEPEEAAAAVAARVHAQLKRSGWLVADPGPSSGRGEAMVVEGTRGGQRARFTVTAWRGEATGAGVVALVTNREERP